MTTPLLNQIDGDGKKSGYTRFDTKKKFFFSVCNVDCHKCIIIVTTTTIPLHPSYPLPFPALTFISRALSIIESSSK